VALFYIFNVFVEIWFLIQQSSSTADKKMNGWKRSKNALNK